MWIRSIEYNPTGSGSIAPVAFNPNTKANGFNLNVIDIALDKPEDESPWASGYHVGFGRPGCQHPGNQLVEQS